GIVFLLLGALFPASITRGRITLCRRAIEALARGVVIAHVGTRAIGGIQIDDVPQKQLTLFQGVTPDEERADRQRTFAETADHLLAASLDPLGDCDLAL